MNTSADAFDPFGMGDEDEGFVEDSTMPPASNPVFSSGVDSWGEFSNPVSTESSIKKNLDAAFESMAFDTTTAHFPSSVDTNANSNGISLDGTDPFATHDNDFLQKLPVVKESRRKEPSPVRSESRPRRPIRVAIHEEMNTTYDEKSRVSTSTIEGTMHVMPCVALKGEPFNITLKDPQKHLETFSEDPAFVDDVTDFMAESFNLKEGDYAFRVGIPQEYAAETVPIASYACNSTLRPNPIIASVDVKHAGRFIRAGIKIRCNPKNRISLRKVAILLAVPPEVNGEKVIMSRKGGIWDPMKRIIIWSVSDMKPAATLELQTQFEFNSEKDEKSKDLRSLPHFPLLIRADANKDQLSSIEVEANVSEKSSSMVQMTLAQSYRIFYRKV